MCGILFVACSTTPAKIETILESSEYIRSRGPDKMTSLVSPKGIYIFSRLSIMDTSDEANQPFVDGDVRLMCNGEIYNYKELIEEYELDCKSGSDCEVILRLYQKLGFSETVKKLNGVYALIITDKDKVYIARDRIGVRPLFFGLTEENYLAIASVPNSLAPFCQTVLPFPPGLCAFHNKPSEPRYDIAENEMVIQSFWEYKGFPKVKFNGDNYSLILADTLTKAVKKRLMSERPIGCLLSGGLDSSIITFILTKLLGPANVRTYSIGMEGSTDLKYAKIVANYLGTKHTEIKFTPKEGIEIIPEVIRVLGSYDITTIRASVGMYLISRYISMNTDDKVIFSGEGSDELLEGYLYFHKAPTPEMGADESLRLVKELYLYDVLRADRTISANGLELREPFLDWDVVNLCMNLPADIKKPCNGYEKHVLRKAFDGCLPDEIIFRKKEGFSDGVSGMVKPWYKHIQEHVDSIISDDEFQNYKESFPSKEAYWYRRIFEEQIPNYNLEVPYWMPRWSDAKDPSGRLFMNETKEKQVIFAT